MLIDDIDWMRNILGSRLGNELSMGDFSRITEFIWQFPRPWKSLVKCNQDIVIKRTRNTIQIASCQKKFRKFASSHGVEFQSKDSPSHLPAEASAISFSCLLCSKDFADNLSLCSHLCILIHEKRPINKSFADGTQCRDCQKEFHTRNRPLTHLN